MDVVDGISNCVAETIRKGREFVSRLWSWEMEVNLRLLFAMMGDDIEKISNRAF
jgi:hypothetical protein